MAITPTHVKKTVTTAGVPVQTVTDTDIKPSSVYFEATGSNTGFIYIGLSDVNSSNYIARLAAGGNWSLTSDALGTSTRGGGSGLQLSSLYIDSSVNGESVQMTYLYPTGG